ncbi:FecR family protein [Chitinophaga niastensis]|uniref:FecR family protein n=1 Tax=Chitinophaga niastensis TaxID=536980 RepID=A0A2P8HJK4_CHINA|nr:FecR family protein [Chitinophaga niastensis]PSL46391.1 FecR family protein [Chitinophaga niastensis]
MGRRQRHKQEKKIAAFFDQLSGQSKETPFASAEERQEAKERLMQSILAHTGQPAATAGRSRWLTWSYAVSGAAAAILLLYWGIGHLHNRAEKALQLTYISTGIHEQKRVYLPDSSVVMLNANSQISYSSNFGVKDRIVSLQKGEAFFNIQHNAASPFSVLSDGITTKVLGTSFNILKYQQSHALKITVKTGKVSVGNAKREFCQLLPADQVMVDSRSNLFTTTHEDGQFADEWMSGRIVIREEPLTNVLERLEMLYGVEFDKHALQDDSLRTITFNANTPLQQVLTIVEKISNVRFKVAKDQHTKIHVYVK